LTVFAHVVTQGSDVCVIATEIASKLQMSENKKNQEEEKMAGVGFLFHVSLMVLLATAIGSRIASSSTEYLQLKICRQNCKRKGKEVFMHMHTKYIYKT
jgi:hypothetical protein